MGTYSFLKKKRQKTMDAREARTCSLKLSPS